jgi:hypothetical protein
VPATTWSGSPGAWQPPLPDPDAVGARLHTIAHQRRVAAFLRATVATDPAGKPTLAWRFDQAALAAEQASDG